MSDLSVVLDLPLHELDGSEFMDRSVYGHRCENYGTLWRPYGHQFVAANQTQIDIPHCDAIDLTGDATIEVWVRPHSATGYVLNKTINGAAASQYAIYNQGTQFVYYPSGGPSSDPADFAYNEWHHVIFTRQDNIGQFHVNGHISGGSQPVDMPSRNTCLNIGMRKINSLWINADIGLVRLYNRTLMPIEISDRFDATKWRFI